MTEYNNSKKSIFLPLLIAAVLVAGMFIGRYIFPQNQKQVLFPLQTNNDKISSILHLIGSNYVDFVSTDSLTEVAIPQILEHLDPHTSYFPPKENDEAHESLQGNFEGIGVQFNIQNDTLLIVNTISGGPSEKIGVLAGDRIIFVNDTLIAGIGIKNEDVMKRLKGKAGTSVKIGVKRAGVKDIINFEIIRDKIPLYSVDAAYMVNDKTGYIKVSKFAETTYDEFMKAAEKLKGQGMTGLVLDLRDNGGGYLSEAVKIADEFLPAGKMIVFTKGAYRKQIEYKSSNYQAMKDIQIVILINSWSASASEIVSGAIQDNDRGIIVGRRSFGKGLVQEEFDFKDRSGIRITTARYFTPVGRSIQKPYKNGYDDYYADIYKRISEGKLISSDSTKFPDSLKYTTPGGKIVYGGGGIMPDYFVPLDTTAFTNYHTKLVSKGLIYKFALNYADKNRKKLTDLESYDKINNFLAKENILALFVDYAAGKGVKANRQELRKSRQIIDTKLRAYIARNIIDNEGFYPIIKEIDDDLKKAVEILNNSKL